MPVNAPTVDANQARAMAQEAAVNYKQGAPPVNQHQRYVQEVRKAANAKAQLEITAGKKLPPKGVAVDHIKDQFNNAGRQGQAENAMNEAYAYSENGTVPDAARAQVIRYLYMEPALRAQLDGVCQQNGITLDAATYANWLAHPGTIPPAVQEGMNDILNDPAMVRHLNAIGADIADLAKTIHDPQGDLLRAEQQHLQEQIDARNDTLNTGADSLNQQLIDTNAELAKYEVKLRPDGTIDLGASGAYAQAREQLAGDLGAAKADAANAANALLYAPTGAPNLAQLRLDAQQTEAKVQQIEQKQKLMDQKEAELKQKQQELKKEIKDVTKEKTDLEAKKGQVDIKVTAADTEQARKEQVLLDRIQNIYGEAAKAVVEERKQMSAEAAVAVLQAENQVETDEDIKAANEALMGDRWNTVKEKGLINKKKVKEIDKDKVGKDYRLLMDKGPEGWVDDAVRPGIEAKVRAKYGVGPYDVLTPQQATDINNEVNARVQKVIKERGPVIAQNVLAWNMRLNGPMSGKDAQILQRSVWGQNMITQVVAQNETWKTEIETACGKGAIDNLSRLPQGVFAKLIMMLMAMMAFGGSGFFGGKKEY